MAGAVISPFWLFSLATALLLPFSLATSLGELLAALPPLMTLPFSSTVSFGLAGASQVEPECQRAPVNVLIWNGARFHRRQGAPVRSNARRLALIAPALAFGFSLGALTGTNVPLGPSLQLCQYQSM
jgi:hypothetical protein